jgi:hypothetical protein
MALNASIFGNMLNAPKSPEEYLAERQSLQASKLANALNQQKADEYTKGVERQGQLRNLLAGGADSGALRLAGFLGEAADWDKNAALVAKDKAAAAKDTNDANLKTWQAYRDQSSMIRNPQEAVAWITRGYNDPIIGPFLQRFGSLEEGVSRIPQDPAGFEQWRMGVGSNVDKMADHAMKQQEFGLRANNELIGPDGKINQTLLGAKKQVAQAGAPVQSSVTYQVDGQGNLVALPTKIPNGSGSVSSVPVMSGGKPVQGSGGKGGGNVTEGERNAAGYLLRMHEATKLLDKFEKTGAASYGTQAAGAIPFAGNMARRAAMSPDQQQYRQAQEDWVRAKLRKESGASIASDEMDREIETYFPMPGEGKEVRAQKRQARQVANTAMQQSAGRAATQQGGGGAAPSLPSVGVVDFGSLK